MILNSGTVIESCNNRKYTVSSLISKETGQGDVYLVLSEDGGQYAFKLFHSGDRGLLQKQMEILMKRGAACEAFVHPIDTAVYNGSIGYFMEYASPDIYLPGQTLYNGINVDGRQIEIDFWKKLSVLHNLSEAISVLYNANLAMMDLKFDNFVFNNSEEDSSVRILDTDTIVGNGSNFRAVDGTDGFMPPLTMMGAEVPDRYNDSYALAVIIFMTLIGDHPLEGEARERPIPPGFNCNIETYQFAAHPVYIDHPTDNSNRNKEAMVKLSKFPEVFRSAMRKTFVDGLLKDKDKRTTPDEWCRVLAELASLSYCCAACQEEVQFITDKTSKVCSCCGEPLVKPLLICGDKEVPAFLGIRISGNDLWSDVSDNSDYLQVVETRHKNKCGFLVGKGKLKLIFPHGRSVELKEGETAPLLMNTEYELNDKKFRVKEI